MSYVVIKDGVQANLEIDDIYFEKLMMDLCPEKFLSVCNK